mmetsp:Transcript_54155/g.137333  ORF Transcript_54155/g.137333 Transcript_54155/m.137333 type:complete len:304 (+) Transcript_54155:29-940(+)
MFPCSRQAMTTNACQSRCSLRRRKVVSLICRTHQDHHFCELRQSIAAFRPGSESGRRIGESLRIQAELDVDLVQVRHLCVAAAGAAAAEPLQGGLLQLRGLQQLGGLHAELQGGRVCRLASPPGHGVGRGGRRGLPEGENRPHRRLHVGRCLGGHGFAEHPVERGDAPDGRELRRGGCSSGAKNAGLQALDDGPELRDGLIQQCPHQLIGPPAQARPGARSRLRGQAADDEARQGAHRAFRSAALSECRNYLQNVSSNPGQPDWQRRCGPTGRRRGGIPTGARGVRCIGHTAYQLAVLCNELK